MKGRVVGGAVVLALAVAVALQSLTFVVGFPTDPLGPAAFPRLAATLLALGGLAIMLGRDEVLEPLPRGAVRRIALASASFVVYALILSPLGFVPATALEFAALAVLFGGRAARSLVVGLVFALVLFGLFEYGLGLPLPLGITAR